MGLQLKYKKSFWIQQLKKGSYHSIVNSVLSDPVDLFISSTGYKITNEKVNVTNNNNPACYYKEVLV